MELLWVVPCLAAVAVAVVVLTGLREIDRAVDDLGMSLRRLEHVRTSVIDLQAELVAASRPPSRRRHR